MWFSATTWYFNYSIQKLQFNYTHTKKNSRYANRELKIWLLTHYSIFFCRQRAQVTLSLSATLKIIKFFKFACMQTKWRGIVLLYIYAHISRFRQSYSRNDFASFLLFNYDMLLELENVCYMRDMVLRGNYEADN